MKTLLRYPGGKTRMLTILRPYLSQLVDGEEHYAEPFTGGGSVALEVARINRSISLVLNDKDELVASLWEIVCGNARGVEELCRSLDVKPTLRLYRRIKETDYRDSLGKAFKCVFLNRCSYNGMIHNSSPMGGVAQRGRWTVGCQYKPEILARLLMEYHGLLKGRATVSCEDALDFIDAHHAYPMS